MRNPFRRQRTPEPEHRDLNIGSVSFPLNYGPSVVTEAVTWEAFRLAPVFAAGRLLASSIASLPLQVYRRTRDGREKIPLPPLFASPSATGTLHDWVWRAITALAYQGNAVGLVTSRDRLEYPLQIEWLNTDLVTVSDSLPNLGERGSFTNPIWSYNGTPLPEEDLVHIPWFVLPGRVWGLSPLGAYASTVRIGLDAQQYKSDWFKSGGVPPGQFRNENQKVEQADAQTIKTRLVQAIRSHEPLVYGKDWQYEPFPIPSSDAQFVETMRLTSSQIASIYGIPPEMIGGETGHSMTYQNVEQQSINFVQFTLLPWLTKLEDVLSTLLPRNQYVKFNVDGLIRTDAATRYANYEKAREVGLLSIDEIREMEDMSPLPREQGNDYTPLAVLTAQAKTPPAAANPLAEPPAETPVARLLRLVNEERPS